MEGNSPKIPETLNQEVSSLCSLQSWLDSEGGNARAAHVFRVLANASLRALKAGQSPPLMERDNLRALVQEMEADTSESPTTKWLITRDLFIWWNSRQSARTSFFLAQGLILQPELQIQEGGGRGNPSRYGLRFAPLTPLVSEPENDQHDSAVTPGEIHYESEPARAIFWLRWLLPPGITELQSWRGPLIVLFALGGMGMIPFLAVLALAALNHPGPLSAKDAQVLLVLALLGYLVYRFMRPWFHLPARRIVIASDFMLATNQLHGQLQLIRNKELKRTGRLSLVRYHSTCAVCAGRVELDDGGREFPERIIGRCQDSPAEHIYSFEPVSRMGVLLRAT